jgi:voltage-gated potassium channel
MDAPVTPQHEAGSLGSALPGTPRARRRVMARSGLRILATTVALFVLYGCVPVPGTSGAEAIIEMIAGLVVFVGLVGWQVRSIVQANHPVLRAVEVMAFALPMLIVLFAFSYLSLSRSDSASFTEHLDHVGAVYYTVSTVSTVGFGDIAAKSDAARILVTAQMLFDLALIAGLVRLVVLAARTGLRQQGRAGDFGGLDR